MVRHEIQVRVRYSETDAMGFLHHANYFNYFEMGRTELLRARGGNYREMEEAGLFFVVVRLEHDVAASVLTVSKAVVWSESEEASNHPVYESHVKRRSSLLTVPSPFGIRESSIC